MIRIALQGYPGRLDAETRLESGVAAVDRATARLQGEAGRDITSSSSEVVARSMDILRLIDVVGAEDEALRKLRLTH